MYIYIYIYIRPASESGLRLCRVKTTESGTCFDRIRRIRGSDSADSGTICPDSRIEDIEICVAIPIRTFSALNSKHTDPWGEAPRSEITNKPSPNKKHKEPLSEAHKCQKKFTDATQEKIGSWVRNGHLLGKKHQQPRARKQTPNYTSWTEQHSDGHKVWEFLVVAFCLLSQPAIHPPSCALEETIYSHSIHEQACSFFKGFDVWST